MKRLMTDAERIALALKAIEARMRGQGMSTEVVLAKLRQYADIAEAGDKPHWAKTMRDAATLMQIFESDEHVERPS